MPATENDKRPSNSVKITIKDRLTNQDYERLIRYCLPYPDGKGGMYRISAEGYTYLVHPSHIRAVRQLLNTLGVIPKIEIKEEAIGTTEAKSPDGRAEMAVKFEIIEKGLIVKMNGSEYFVPQSYIDILLEEIRKSSPIMPRQLWARLAERHQLFPGLEKAIKIVYADSSMGIAEKQQVINELYSHRASLFEGLRVRRKENTTQTYYQMYWLPMLWLKRQDLIEQNGSREIYVKQKELK